jgi:hypothetical protein
MVEQARQPIVVDFQFEFLVEAVDQLRVDTILKTVVVLLDAHPHVLRLDGSSSRPVAGDDVQ